MVAPDFIGTLPGWATFVVILTIGLRWEILRRRANTERLGVENADVVDIRDHYAKEVASLRVALREQDERFRKLLEASDRRHAECEEARVKLNNEIGVLRREIDGLVRVIAQASIDRVVMLGDDVPIDVRQAAARAQTYIKRSEGDKH